MIIGINGKIGSGKDTVGKIIQYLTLPNTHGPYIGFETFDDNTLARNSKFEIKKFAGKLKQTASLLTGIPIEKFEDQEFKQSYLGSEWATVRVNPLNAIPVFENVQFNEVMSVRELLQKLGTDAVRDGLHKDAWVNALFADYKSKRELLQADGTWIESDTGEVDFGVSIKYPKWIITDMRFSNEMEAIVKRGGLTIKVIRPVKKSKTTPRLHPSETALDGHTMHYDIINDGSMEDLIAKVREILIEQKII
jgi:hypothetical protein